MQIGTYEVYPHMTYADFLQAKAQELAMALMKMQGDVHTLHDASVNEFEEDPQSYEVNELTLGHNLGNLSVGPRTEGTRLLAALASAEDAAWDLYAKAGRLTK